MPIRFPGKSCVFSKRLRDEESHNNYKQDEYYYFAFTIDFVEFFTLLIWNGLGFKCSGVFISFLLSSSGVKYLFSSSLFSLWQGALCPQRSSSFEKEEQHCRWLLWPSFMSLSNFPIGSGNVDPLGPD